MDPKLEKEVKVPSAEEPKEVAVDLNKQEVKPDAAAEAAARQKAAEDAAEKDRKQLGYATRKLEAALKKIDELTTSLKPAPAAKPAEEVEDPIEAAANKNWQLGVGMLLDKKLTEREQKEKEASEERARVAKLDRARTTVLNRYPTIEDDSTEEGRLYIQAMNAMAAEDPRIYQNEYGPVLVMHRMEEMMQEAGKLPPAYRPQVEQEVNSEVKRRQRIGAGSLPAGRQNGSENIVVLTAEEQQICKENGITLERFAQMKRLTGREFRDGVTVS